MKKLIFILVFAIVAIAANAQKGKVKTLAVDTLQGAETVNFGVITATGDYRSIDIQAVCTELGGTSDGTLFLKGSVDGLSYIDITDASGLLKGFPNDTLTITDGAIWNVVIQDVPFKYIRPSGTGTASDTTSIQFKYVFK